MIKIDFTTDQIDELRNLENNHLHPLVRRKALVILLKSSRIKHCEISKIAGVCDNTIRGYFKEYKAGGIEAIKKVIIKKRSGKLVKFEQSIKEYIEETPPATINEACHEIEKLTGIQCKETQTRLYLKSLGVKFRKVCGIPAKADIAQQEKFLDNELQPRLDEAEKGLRNVYFVDAAHFVLGAFLGFLWSFTRIFVKTPSGRQRFNVLGALNAITKELITVTNSTYITSTQVCELLNLIAQKNNGQVTVVLDNAAYQRCKAVTDKAEALGIELLFLPPYSPNLNLIERIWKFTKKNCLNSKYYENFDLFRTSITTFLAGMHKTHRDELNTLLSLKFQMFTDHQIASELH